VGTRDATRGALPGEDLGPCAAAPVGVMLRSADHSISVEPNATRFRALGDPTRLRVVPELVHGTRCVCELRDRIGVSGSLLSHHLTVLRDSGLVAASRRGRWVDYTLDVEALVGAFAAVTPEVAGAVR
jgi:ArsR family transcriptional regulator, arsenate/arsenite/antimonite-responsive transcriptional repressor